VVPERLRAEDVRGTRTAERGGEFDVPEGLRWEGFRGTRKVEMGGCPRYQNS
jgi:hypothetical protein